MFTRVEGKVADTKPMRLKVDRIVAYGHALNALPQGMTGELIVSGDGSEQLGGLTFPVVLGGNE